MHGTATRAQVGETCATQIQGLEDLLIASCNERSFLALELAFSGTGGLLSEPQFLQRLQMFCDQPISKFARWIVDRLFHVASPDFVPSFQFVALVPRIRPQVQTLVAELRALLGDWELAVWVAIPNVWLADPAPVDVLGTDIDGVLRAARTERFVRRG